MTDGGPIVDLRILATSDLHLSLMPYDYMHASRRRTGGLALLAPVIRRLRDEAANALLFDNGDFLQGNPLGDHLAGPRGVTPRRPHPMIAAMNALGYDAVALGNHDFNYGLPFLHDCLAAASFPVVASNLHALDPQPALWQPQLMLRRRVTARDGTPHALSVGVIGLLPPQVTIWDELHLAGKVEATGIVAAARAGVASLRAAGAEIVVALAHSGFGANVGPDEADPMAENATIAVSRIAGIDAVVAGHTHELFPHPGPHRRPDRCGCPTVMPGWEGSHVGVIDLTLAPAAPGGWRVASGRCRVVAGERDAAGRRCATIVAAVASDHRAVRRNLHRIVGETRDRISTHFALAGDSSAAGLVAQACRAEAERMAAGTPYSGLPVLAASAPFLCGGRAGPDSYTDIPEGPLRMHHLCELSPYPNRLDVMTISGAGLRDWLEMSARVFATLTPGRTDQPLVAGVTPGYLFDVIAGATYRIDPSANPLFSVSGRRSGGGPGRIRDLRVAGRPVRDSDRFLLAASTFRVSGGGRFPGTGAGKSVLRSDGSIRDILARELCRRTAPVCTGEPIWRFVDLPGTSAILATAPAAAARTGDAGRVPLGLNDRGFLQVRIAL